MNYLSRLGRASFLLALAIFCADVAWGQVTTATVYGTVTDASGGVIPGATVTLIHEATQATIIDESDGGGDFQFDFVRVGLYTMSIEAPGFKRFQSSMELTGGQQVRRSFALEVGEVTETVEVASAAPLVNTVSAEQLQTFEARKVLDLPLARRNISGLLPIGTGVNQVGDRRYGGIRMNGVGMNGTKFSVDGTEATGNPEGNSPRTHQGGNLIDIMSIEGVQELHVVKGILPAEYGGMVAGQVTILTKSGTNEFHGSLFENFQSNSLNAKDPFLAQKPPFTYNQFGGSAGGPIVKNKVFLFGDYEGYRESRFRRLTANVPTQSHRNLVIAAQPDYALPLEIVPLPNQPHDPDGTTGEYINANRESSTDNHVDIKGDIHLSSTKMLSLTYSRGRPLRQRPQIYLNESNDEHIQIFSERGTASFVTSGVDWTSESRFGYTMNDSEQLNQYILQRDPLNSTEEAEFGRRLGRISPNLGWGTAGSQHSILEGPVINISEKFAKHMGSHSLKFGGQYAWRSGMRNKVNNPRFNYTGLDDFLNNIPSRVTASHGQGEHTKRLYDFGFFLQDDWRVRSNLTLNFGIRYEFFSNTVATPKNGSESYLYNAGLADAQFNIERRDKSNPYNHDKMNLAPRFGFSWDVGGQGKTVVRGGFGTLFSPQMAGSVSLGVQSRDVPRRLTFSRQEALDLGMRFPMFSDDIRKIIEQRAQETGFDSLFTLINPTLQNPYAMHYTLGIQRELTPTLVFETAFVGLQGRKFMLWRFPNEPDRQTGLRPNPNLAASHYADQSQTVSFTSWQTSLRKRYSRNMSGSIHYTWGKSISAVGQGGDPGAYYHEGGVSRLQDFFDLKASRGVAFGDVTHNVAAEMIYELPRLSNVNSAIARQVLGGWRVASVFIGQTGQPVNITQSSALRVTRPDYIGGEAVLDNYNDTRRYLNQAVFAKVPIVQQSGASVRPGSIGAAAVRGPGAWNIDFSMAKDFKLTEKITFQLRTDMFNALNHVSLSNLNTNLNSSTFGFLRGTKGQREIQLNGRISW